MAESSSLRNIIIVIIIITDLYSAFRSEDTEALDVVQVAHFTLTAQRQQRCMDRNGLSSSVER